MAVFVFGNNPDRALLTASYRSEAELFAWFMDVEVRPVDSGTGRWRLQLDGRQERDRAVELGATELFGGQLVALLQDRENETVPEIPAAPRLARFNKEKPKHHWVPWAPKYLRCCSRCELFALEVPVQGSPARVNEWIAATGERGRTGRGNGIPECPGPGDRE